MKKSSNRHTLDTYTIGVDIGGTFTDLVSLDHKTGATSIAKVPSTPPTYADGFFSALALSARIG